MKKLVFGLIATVVLSLTGNTALAGNTDSAPTAPRVKLFCVTVSCCSVGPVGIEIWSETTCHYVSVHKIGSNTYTHGVKFQTEGNPKEITIGEDVLLAGFKTDEGEDLILAAGTYPVEDNVMYFNPTTYKARRYCYERDVKGNFMGHDYSYHIEICVSFGRAANDKGVVAIDPKLSDEQLAELAKNGNEISFDEDMTISDKNVSYTVTKGTYTVNEDGNIYIQNTPLK